MKLFNNIKQNFPKDLASRIILGAMVALALVGAFFGYRFVRQAVASNETFALPGDPVLVSKNRPDENDTQATRKPTDIPAAMLPTPEPWDGVSRVNLLMMGLDYRDWEAGDTPRTDTMMVLTLDPLNKTAGMLSIPRDLWVAIPGFDYGKINTAYYLGELYNLPGGGPGLAVRTVEELLGVPIQYYAQIDFQAFVDFINHIEGVRLTFDEPMVLDRRGKWNTVTIEPGVVTLSGEYALAFVRARKTEGGDFDRAARQQYLMMAVRDRILEFNMMPKMVARAPEIYNDLAAGIHTNMSLNEAIKLGWTVLDLDRDAIKQLVIGSEYITMDKSPDGLDVLKPIPDKIRVLRDEAFGEGGSMGPVAEGEILDIIREEAARISIRNGSSVPGLAANTASWLRDQGFNIVEETNADYQITTQIYLHNSTPYAMRWLAETMGVTATRIFYNFGENPNFDLIIVLGDDWAASNPLP